MTDVRQRPEELTGQPDEPAPPVTKAEADVPLREAFHRVNAFFYNKKTGLGLILAMAFLTLMGTLLEQVPEETRNDPKAWASWLDRVRPRYGGWTDILGATGMFDVFGSVWFRGVTLLLAISIIACTCHRLPQLWQRARSPHLHVSEAFFDRAGIRGQTVLPEEPEAALATVKAALAGERYRVLDDERGPGLNIYADRFRWMPFGTALAHASFVIILIGVLVSTTFAFKNPNLPVPVGTRAEVGHNTGLSIEATSFTDKYTEKGRPVDYFSSLILYKDGVKVGEQTVRVNTPMRYEGVAIHQASYGIAASMKVTDEAGAEVFSGGVPLAWQTDDKRRSIGKVKLENKNLTMYVVGASSGVIDQEIGAGQLLLEIYRGDETRPLATQVISQGQPAKLGDLTYTFERERQYTGLMIVRDPGALWVWIGSGLMVIGLIMTMFLHHRRLWLRLTPAPDGGTLLRVACPERQDTLYQRWVHTFTARLTDPDAHRGESLADLDRRRRR